jgi:hypothetical protein
LTRSRRTVSPVPESRFFRVRIISHISLNMQRDRYPGLNYWSSIQFRPGTLKMQNPVGRR